MNISNETILDQMKEAVEEVFSTMLDTVAKLVERGECHHSNGEESEAKDDSVEIEAVVDFSGNPNGSVILRATAQGALDIARKLLMMEDDEVVDLEEVQDALGECANMVTGALKTRALDPEGSFQLSMPRIDTRVHVENEHPAGGLVFELAQGNVSVEIWLSEATG
ncbi:MAG: CheY-specific phosphatase CheX [Candidatus Paceibacteria bacterium]|jgi:CheY-specific phosphatase CheX